MRASIVIPAYNEERRIKKTLERYSYFFEKLRKEKKLDYQILVSINNTKDRTKEIVKRFSKGNKRIDYIDLLPGGKGYAVIEGFKKTLEKDSDLMGFVDADMATSPEEYYKLIKEIGNYDGIIASRWVKGAVVIPKPKMRRMIARWMFNSLIRSILFLPYRDTQCGAKVFRRNVIETAIQEITMSEWAFDVDLLYVCKKRNFKIREIPTVWTDKEYSKINFWKAGPRMALGVIRLRILNSPFRKVMNLYDKLKINIV